MVPPWGAEAANDRPAAAAAAAPSNREAACLRLCNLDISHPKKVMNAIDAYLFRAE